MGVSVGVKKSNEMLLYIVRLKIPYCIAERMSRVTCQYMILPQNFYYYICMLGEA